MMLQHTNKVSADCKDGMTEISKLLEKMDSTGKKPLGGEE